MGLVSENEHKSLFRRDSSDSPTCLMEQGGSFSASLRVRDHHRSPNNTLLQSFNIVILSNKLNLLLPFGPLAILLHYLTDNKVNVVLATQKVLFMSPTPTNDSFFVVCAQGWVFLFSLLGITPLAERLGYATEYVCRLSLSSFCFFLKQILIYLCKQAIGLLHRSNWYDFLMKHIQDFTFPLFSDCAKTKFSQLEASLMLHLETLQS